MIFYYLLTTVYVVVCLVLLLVILLQQGKGGDMASAFGGGSSQTAFGARGGATLLSKVTTVSPAFPCFNRTSKHRDMIAWCSMVLISCISTAQT